MGIEEEVIKRLKNIKDPITEESIVDLGMVVSIVEEEGEVKLYLDLSRGAQGPFMNALTWPVRAKIVRDVVAVLLDLGKVEILDARSFQRYYPGDE
ncbi:iron-sulfur cluster assembly protein [Thermococcus zilligii]|uniref:iron-sulfur cluster assembly protein n=1 Tax=Thermococcus zilligii TaxID=54076 RepID=UPI00029A9E8F|nr:iron-sulfur cluster assembly protein [Thermococcus zilligii]